MAWILEQRAALVAETASAAARQASLTGAAFVSDPKGPWSASMLASVAGSNPAARACVCLTRLAPHQPRPLYAVRRGWMTCNGCASSLLDAADPNHCHCCRSESGLRPVVVHTGIVILIGALCPRCLLAESTGRPSRRRRRTY